MWMSMSSEGWLVKTTSRPGTNEVHCLFYFFIHSLFHFFFFFFLARSDKPRYPPADNERRSAAGPEWSDGSWATPRDASWSIPPGNRPTGKHLASWGITYQMEPGYVLVDSQKSCRAAMRGATYSLPTPTDRNWLTCCRCRDVWPPTRMPRRDWRRRESFESESARKRREGGDKPDSRHGFPPTPLERKHV